MSKFESLRQFGVMGSMQLIDAGLNRVLVLFHCTLLLFVTEIYIPIKAV